MSQYLEGQIHQLAEALQEHGFTPADVTALGQNSNGVLKQIKLVLMGVATIVRYYFKLALDKAFNSSEFLGKDWKVAERDEREDGLAEVDWSKVDFETCLKDGESSITGEEKLKRLKAGRKVRLGGRAFLSLWRDYQAKKEASVLEQLYKTKKIAYVDFMGLILRTSNGSRCVLYLYRHGDGGWDWHYSRLSHDRVDGSFSAVSAQVSSN